MKPNQKCKIALLLNDFYSEYTIAICKGVLHAAHDFGISVVVFGVGELKSSVRYTQKRNKLYSLVHQKNFDGILYLSTSLANNIGIEGFLNFIKRYGTIPTAHIGIQTPEHSCFNIDDFSGMYALVEHLIKKHSRKKIAFITGNPGVYEADTRFLAYKKALKDNNIEFNENYVFVGNFVRESGILAVKEFLEKRKISFDALVGANDLMALYAMKELQNRGFKIPEDISIGGFDDLNSATSYNPKLTTVHQPARELGYIALKEFASALISGSNSKQNYQLETKLILRQSCGCNNKDSDSILTIPEIPQIPDLPQHKQDELNTILNVITRNIIESFEEADICNVLDDGLKLLNIKNLIIAKYNNTNKTQVFYDFNKNTNTTTNPQKLISDFCNNSTACANFVFPLYYNEEDIGFFISDANPNQLQALEILGAHLSAALKAAQLLGDAHKVSDRLEKEVKIRTKQLAQRSADLEAALEKITLANKKLELLAVIDELTGLYNRRGFMTSAKQNIELAKRNKTNVMLIFFDLDGLKQINDNFGHASGDIAIKAMATILQMSFRKSDVIARMGGDEFTVLSIDCSYEQYTVIVDRINHFIDDYNKNKHEFTLAVSSGATPYDTNKKFSIKKLLEKADKELYKVKAKKKNLKKSKQ